MTKLSFSFLPIPEEIMESKAISWGAKHLFGIIAKSNLEEVRWRSKNLSKRMKCSLRETTNRLKELKENNLIISQRTGRGNIYRINLELISLIQEKEIGTNVPIRKAHSVPIRKEDSVPIVYKEHSLNNNIKEGLDIKKLKRLNDLKTNFVKKTEMPNKTEPQEEVAVMQRPSGHRVPQEDTLTRLGHFMHGP